MDDILALLYDMPRDKGYDTLLFLFQLLLLPLAYRFAGKIAFLSSALACDVFITISVKAVPVAPLSTISGTIEMAKSHVVCRDKGG